MTFQDVYKELLDLTNTSDAFMLHRAKRAVNRALAWMLNQHNFLYNETSTSVTCLAGNTEITAPAGFSKLVSACFANEGKTLKVMPYELFRAKKDLYEMRTTSSVGDISYFQDFIVDAYGYVITQRGNKLVLVPGPVSDVALSLYYQKAFVPLTLESDTHFLLDAFPDTVMLKAITAVFRAYLKPEIAASFPAELFLSEWSGVIAWDVDLRSNSN